MILLSVDCTWNYWSEWSSCSMTCGSGTKTRSRTQNGPSNGGKECSGSSISSTSCNLIECPRKALEEVWVPLFHPWNLIFFTFGVALKTVGHKFQNKTKTWPQIKWNFFKHRIQRLQRQQYTWILSGSVQICLQWYKVQGMVCSRLPAVVWRLCGQWLRWPSDTVWQ